MSTIGQYNLLVSEDGEYAVEWYSNKKRNVVRLPNFVDVIDMMVDEQLATRKHFVEIFQLAFFNNAEEKFLEHPDSVILNYLKDEETKPDTKMSIESLFEFNVKKFLLAYNRWKGTSLKYSEVIDLCRRYL